MLNEILTQRTLGQCPGTTKIFKVYENAVDIGILMEFHEGDNLADVIKRKGDALQESHIKLIVAQVLLSVDFLALKDMTHRDLKPENVLYHNPVGSSNQDVRVADFGFAISLKETYEEPIDMVCGTPGFIAPEALNKQGFNSKSDVFSVGSMLYSLLTRRYLFPGIDNREAARRNKVCEIIKVKEKII